MKTVLDYSALVILLAFLTSCGYSLRTNQLIEGSLDTIHLTFSQPNSEFSRILRQNLELADVKVINSIESQQAHSNLTHELSIGGEEISTRPITINSRARAAQYEMRLSIEITLRVNETFLIESEALFVDSIYFEDIENITGNQEEIRIITSEMRQNLVSQVMRRLESAIN